MDNRTGLEAQMAKHIHFIYIGRPPDNKDPNLILGCLDIIDVELLRSTGVTFHFWVIDEAERWKEVINNIGNYIDYDKYIMSHKNITALVNSIAVLPNDILDDLRRLDDGLIPEGAKRNIMKKDLSSIAVLKKYGGYYLDNNVFPNTSSSFLNFDEGVDFKAPADPRKLMKLYEYHSGAYGCFKTTVKRRFSMPRLDPPEEEPVEAYQIPTIECWAMYSTSDGQTINKIYNQYFYNLETLNNMLSRKGQIF